MYEEITYEKIRERMLGRVSDKFDKREGSLIYDTHAPSALEFLGLYIELERIIKESYGDTASRDYLVLRCKERGIVPYEATAAVLKGKFSPNTVKVLGKRFSIGDRNYLVTEKITAGEYRVQCETVGITGNQWLGSMIPIEYIEGLETAELTEVLIPGKDEEETEALRERYFASFDRKAFGGNRQDYLEKTNELPGVGSTKVTRVWNGDISPSSLIPSETVTTWYQNIQRTLTGEVAAWLTALYTAAAQKKLTTGGTVLLTILNSDFSPASDTLVQAVQEAIDPEQNAGEGYGLAPIGHVVTVKSAEGVAVQVKATLTFETGYTWAILQSSLEDVIASYLLELRRAWAESSSLIVRVSQIESRILGITGILDIKGTTLNGVTDNLLLGEYQVPVYGGCSE